MPDLHRMKQVEVAEVLGVSARQVHNLVKEGMPRHAENGKTFYDAPECVAWYLVRKMAEAESNAEPTSEIEAKAKLDGLRADLLEIELQKARGQVMPVEYAVSQLEGIGARLRTKMQVLPTKWAPALVGAQTIPEMATRLEVVVQDAMKVLVTVADDLDLEEAA